MKINIPEILKTAFVYFLGLTRDEVAANAVSFFVAGYETTATALQYFFYAMAVYPEIQQQVAKYIFLHINFENLC